MSIEQKPNTQGVVLTGAEVAQSNANKKRHRAITQLPVYRNAVMLLDYIVDVVAKCPRNVRKFTDSTIECSNELLRHIGLSQEHKGEERIMCIIEAMSFVYVLKSHFAVYAQKGIISKDSHNKVKKLCDNTASQLSGWRDFVKREGLDVLQR